VGRPCRYLPLLAVLLLAPPVGTAAADPYPFVPPPPKIAEAKHLSVFTDNPYARDRRLLATVSPNGDGYRDLAYIRFFLTAPARVTIRAQSVQRNFQRIAQPQWVVQRAMQRGWQQVTWRPSPTLEPTTYAITVSVTSGTHTERYGRLSLNSYIPAGPIVRILGVDANFDRSSYAPGETAQLTVSSDSLGLTLRIVDVAGTDVQPTVDQLDGPDVIPPQHFDWEANRDHAVTLPVTIGDWKPGVYFAVVSNDAGNVGYAPLLVRAPKPTARVAVLIPGQTWYAYDFYDDDRDGFPNSWYYTGGSDIATLVRPFAHRGVPWQFGSQLWPFLRWLRLHNVTADFLTESDAVALAPSLAQDYDLIVVPTHLEYVTEPQYDAIQHFRDEGGDLIFLASNDFYWRVDISGNLMQRVARWRDLGRPEAALVGAQYAGSKTNDVGPYVISDATAVSWVFQGTGLSTNDFFSYAGNEFDVRTAASPPNTQLLATVRTPTHRGEMTYYELGNAKVFAPGTFFSWRLLQPAESRLLENVWNHSDAPDLPPPPAPR
jgi:hypothetical protein